MMRSELHRNQSQYKHIGAGIGFPVRREAKHWSNPTAISCVSVRIGTAEPRDSQQQTFGMLH